VLAATPRLPQKCADQLKNAASQERRSAEAKGQVLKAERELRRCMEQRRELEKAGKDAALAAEERRKDAEEALARLKVERRQAEEEHRRSEQREEDKTHEELASIEARIEAERQIATARSRELRKQTTEQRSRVSQEIEALRAEFARRHDQHEQSLSDHDAECAAAMTTAEQRCKDADERAHGKWRECEEQIVALHISVNGEVDQVHLSKTEQVAVTNRRLEEMDAKLVEVLQELAAAEEANNKDRSAEDRAATVMKELDEDVRRRRQACDETLKNYGEELAHLMSSTTSMGERALIRARITQETADREVEAIRARMEQFSRERHERKIAQLQTELNALAVSTREGLTQRLAQFRTQAGQQAVKTDRAKVAADLQVRQMRDDLQGSIMEKTKDVEQVLEETKRARDETQNTVSEKIWQTQERMMKYITTMQDDMLEALKSPDFAEFTLSLPLPSATPSPPLYALGDITMKPASDGR